MLVQRTPPRASAGEFLVKRGRLQLKVKIRLKYRELSQGSDIFVVPLHQVILSYARRNHKAYSKNE